MIVRLLSIAALIAPALASAADVEFPWSARLNDVTGAPITGAHPVRFTLRDPDSAVLWSKTYMGVSFVGGYASVVLSGQDDTEPSANALDSSLFLDDVFLSVALDNADDLLPATALSSVPRAAAVVGSVQLDDSLTQCVAGTQGALRWASGAVEACNGIDWVRIIAGDSVSVAGLGAFGSVQSDTSITSQNGQVQRDIATFRDTAHNAVPIHIKTNIPVQSSVMYRLVVEGYNYGVAQPVNIEAVGYPYSQVTCLVADSVTHHTSGTSLNQYCSRDGFVVLRLTASSFYYVGLTVSAFMLNPTGTSFPVSVQFFRQSGDL